MKSVVERKKSPQFLVLTSQKKSSILLPLCSFFAVKTLERRGFFAAPLYRQSEARCCGKRRRLR